VVAHSEIAKKFAARKLNRRTGDCSWSGSRMYASGDTLYSYGSHFPLARFLGEKAGESVFIKNGDRYSSSTSGHQSITQGACKGPTVSVSALRAAGINFYNLALPPVVEQKERRYESDSDQTYNNRLPAFVIAYRPDFREHIYRDKEGGYWRDLDYKTLKSKRPNFSNPFVPPRQGMFVPYGGQEDDDRYKSGCWHILGAALIRRADQDFLCSLDEGQYFVAQLPHTVRNIDQAFNALKPQLVRRAERAGLAVVRQGEWFFIPTGLDHAGFAQKVGLTKTKVLELAKIAPLPQRQRANIDVDTRTRNKHCCRQFFVVDEGIYTFGSVYHRNGWNDRVTNEHRTLKLGDQWHRVCLNTEVASWTVGGRFD
jgi:hypothetical protein